MKKILAIALFLPLIGLAQTKTTTKKKKTKAKTSTTATTTTTTTPTAIKSLTATDAINAASSTVSTVSNTISTVTGNSSLSSAVDISAGLKEALNKGITQQVSKLALTDGFYKNSAVKILVPKEIEIVEKTLRKYGMSTLADEGIKTMNRAAEDAIKSATPIFVDAVKNMTINDAKNILLGNDNAGTTYLQTATSKVLTAKLNPIIKQSMSRVGADLVWNSIISKYNAFPLMGEVNPDITSYVTEQTLNGVFKMISVEEKKIRTDLNSRTSGLLQQVFAMQDNK